jgi:hypothetical protein
LDEEVLFRFGFFFNSSILCPSDGHPKQWQIDGYFKITRVKQAGTKSQLEYWTGAIKQFSLYNNIETC